MKVLITGGAGFIGSKIALRLKTQYPSYEVTALDNLSRRGSELNINHLRDNSISYVHGDIRNMEDLEGLPDFDAIIDASADPSVLAGIDSSARQLINTNLLGTVNIAELASRCHAQLVFLSTSRVYPIEQLNKIKLDEEEDRFVLLPDQDIAGVTTAGIDESFPIQGSKSFYGASKYASEVLLEEYRAFKGVPCIINRCGVIAGPGQFGKVDQGVLMHWLLSHYWKRKLSYFGFGGRGQQVRDMLHIEDLLDLIDMQIHDFATYEGKTLNVGGGLSSSVSLAQLTELCQDVTGNHIDIGSVPANRTADIPLYITNNSSIQNLNQWTPQRTPAQIVMDAYQWLRSNEQLLKRIL